MRDCAEGHRPGQPGQTQDDHKGSQAFTICAAAVATAGCHHICCGSGHGLWPWPSRAELSCAVVVLCCASLPRQLTVLGSIKRISTELWQSTHAAGHKKPGPFTHLAVVRQLQWLTSKGGKRVPLARDYKLSAPLQLPHYHFS